MAKIRGITQYECDRCGAKTLLTDDSPELADWHEVTRTTADGAERRVLMCSACHADYRLLVQVEDKDFNSWMEEGR